MRRIARFSLGVALLAATAAAAQDTRLFHRGAAPYTLAPRIALVIGVSSVNESGLFYSLPNPANDATEISKALRAIGFAVLAPHENYSPAQITRQLVKRYLYDFALLLRETKGALGLVYFSGHGIQLYGQHFLVAHDGYVRYDRDLQEELIPITWFYDAFRYAETKLNLLFIDACRNFPWSELPQFGTPLRLERNPPESGNVRMAYATLSGKRALDGNERISPYAAAFLDALKKPDLPLGEFLASIEEHVRKTTDSFQVPKGDSIGQVDFVFHPTQATFEREAHVFLTGKQGPSRALLEKITTRYAFGYFAREAESLLPTIPTARPPASFVEVRERARLHDLPRRDARELGTVEAGSQLGVEEGIAKFTHRDWVPVRWGASDDVAYVERRLVANTRLVSQTYPMQFRAGAAAGSEVLTEEARARLKDALQDATRVRRAEVKAYAYQPEGSAAISALHRLPVRQATVVQALKEAGYGGPGVQTAIELSTDQAKDGAVELVVTRAVREP